MKRLTSLTSLVTALLICTAHGNISDNEVNPDAAFHYLKNFLGSEEGKNIFGSLMQSDMGKQMGSLFTAFVGNPKVSQPIVDGISSLLRQEEGDPNGSAEMLMQIFSGFHENHYSPETMPSLLQIVSTVLSFLSSHRNLELLQTFLIPFGGFTGPEAEEREAKHAGHAWMLPPVIERLHVMMDHFMNTEFMKDIIKISGVEKFFKQFSNETGRFQLTRFFELMENHSFRKHWISKATIKLGEVLSYVLDPVTHKKYYGTLVQASNGLLRRFNVPRAYAIDENNPIDSFSAVVDYFANNIFGARIHSKPILMVAGKYVNDLISITRTKQPARAAELSDHLADTINMEVIEPVLRVHRAYRFSLKHAECAPYVICLVNDHPNETYGLPFVRKIMTRSLSLIGSIALHMQAKDISFGDIYPYIIYDELRDCSKPYKPKCHDFHLHEEAVRKPYVHTEL